VLKLIFTHTFLVSVTVGRGHAVYRKVYTLIGGQHAENFENHFFKLSCPNPLSELPAEATSVSNSNI